MYPRGQLFCDKRKRLNMPPWYDKDEKREITLLIYIYLWYEFSNNFHAKSDFVPFGKKFVTKKAGPLDSLLSKVCFSRESKSSQLDHHFTVDCSTWQQCTDWIFCTFLPIEIFRFFKNKAIIEYTPRPRAISWLKRLARPTRLARLTMLAKLRRFSKRAMHTMKH